jgi:Raf kinase inhibitor-like YbhB/YbcL family protein
MKRTLLSCAAVAVSLLVSAEAARAQNPPAQGAAPRPPAMVLTTSGWADGDPIPAKYTQAVQAPVSPALSWTNTPAGTASFALVMHDADVAQTRGTDDFLHWLVWNIPGASTSLPEAVPAGPTLPDGTQQIAGRGNAYIGPGAPATGPMHHYIFELYALDTRLTVAPAATPAETRAAIITAMNGHVLGKAVYVGLFRRPAP